MLSGLMAPNGSCASLRLSARGNAPMSYGTPPMGSNADLIVALIWMAGQMNRERRTVPRA